jgi:ribose transport system substrate-binding protein
MSRRILAAMAAAALIAVPACGEIRESGGGGGGGGEATKKEGPIRIAVVPKAVGFDFWETVREGAECAASKSKDVKVSWDGVTAESDVTGQITLLQNFITQGVDGLVFAATDAKALNEVTKQARSKNIPVANIDSGTDPRPPDVPLFATDNVAGAEKIVDVMAEELGPEGGKVALVAFNPGSQTNNERTEGFKKGLKKHPELELVAEQNSQSDFNKALNITQDILTANRDLKAVFGSAEPSALGAAAAVRRAGKKGEVKVYGWDAAPDELKAVREGAIEALIVQNPFNMGYKGVSAVIKMVREGAPAKSEDTGGSLVTRENLREPEIKAVLEPSCANPPV